jgi:hypothetical protein
VQVRFGLLGQGQELPGVRRPGLVDLTGVGQPFQSVFAGSFPAQ